MPLMAPERREAAQAMLLRKARIVHKGAVKHENEDLQQQMGAYLARWQ